MIEAAAFLLLVVAMFVVLYAAFGRDGRDNMRGGCKAAAVRALDERTP